MHIFVKVDSTAKKASVSSTTFLFRGVEQLAVYQLLPNLAI